MALLCILLFWCERNLQRAFFSFQLRKQTGYSGQGQARDTNVSVGLNPLRGHHSGRPALLSQLNWSELICNQIQDGGWVSKFIQLWDMMLLYGEPVGSYALTREHPVYVRVVLHACVITFWLFRDFGTNGIKLTPQSWLAPLLEVSPWNRPQKQNKILFIQQAAGLV